MTAKEQIWFALQHPNFDLEDIYVWDSHYDKHDKTVVTDACWDSTGIALTKIELGYLNSKHQGWLELEFL